jgi:hypothetical protein
MTQDLDAKWLDAYSKIKPSWDPCPDWQDRYLYDNDDDIKFLRWLHTGPERLSVQQQVAWSSIDWEWCMRTPRFIGLPAIIYFSPKKHNPFPTGVLWAILMTFKFNGEKKKPRYDGIVFVGGNQYEQPPRHLSYCQLYKWAINRYNVPESLRFYSMNYALKIMCGTPQSPFPCKGNRSDKFFLGPKSWYFDEWDMSIETIVNEGIPFIECNETLPPYLTPTKPKILPRHPKKTSRKRKKTDNIDQQHLLETTDWTGFDVPSLNSPTQ